MGGFYMSELKLIMPHTELLVFLLNFSRFEIMRTTSDSSFYLFFCNQFVILPFVVSHLSLPPCFHITLFFFPHITLLSQTLPPLLLFPFFFKKKTTPRLQVSWSLVLSRSHLAHRSWLTLLKILHYSCYLWVQQYSMSNTPTCSQGLSLAGPTYLSKLNSLYSLSVKSLLATLWT